MMLESVIHALTEQTQPVYFVGGCLRQYFLKKPIHDYDFVVEGSAIALARKLSQRFSLPCFILDTERDIARVALSREDTLDFASLQGKDLKNDLLQRDLTLNAMALPVTPELLHGTVTPEMCIDPVGGYADLQAGIVRGIQEANFLSDPLRLIRAFRFATQHGFSIEPETLAWTQQHAVCLESSASERILAEITKILNAKHLDVLSRALPVLSQITGISEEKLSGNVKDVQALHALLISQHNPYFKTPVTGERQVSTLCLCFVLCFAHEFRRGVDMLGAEGAKVFLSTIKSKNRLYKALSNSEQAFLQRLVQLFMDLGRLRLEDKITQSQVLRTLKSEVFSAALLAHLWQNESPVMEHAHRQLQQMVVYWKEKDHPIAHPIHYLKGHEIAELLNEKPGPRIGQIISQLLDAQAVNEVTDRASAIRYLQQNFKRE